MRNIDFVIKKLLVHLPKQINQAVNLHLMLNNEFFIHISTLCTRYF